MLNRTYTINRPWEFGIQTWTPPHPTDSSDAEKQKQADRTSPYRIRLSTEAKQLKQEYDTKEALLEQRHNNEKQQVKRRYRQEQQKLEQDYTQKKASLSVNIYT